MGERLGEGVALATTQKTPPHPNLLPQIQGCVLRQLSSLALPLNLGEKEQEVRNFKGRRRGYFSRRLPPGLRSRVCPPRVFASLRSLPVFDLAMRPRALRLHAGLPAG